MTTQPPTKTDFGPILARLVELNDFFDTKPTELQRYAAITGIRISAIERWKAVADVRYPGQMAIKMSNFLAELEAAGALPGDIEEDESDSGSEISWTTTVWVGPRKDAGAETLGNGGDGGGNAFDEWMREVEEELTGDDEEEIAEEDEDEDEILG